MSDQYSRTNTLRVPITVTLRTATSARNITREVGDVQFRSTVPGGFATCTVTLNRPFKDYSDELVQFAQLRLTDGRNGGVLWEGRLEDPGRTASDSGQVWSLSAVGPMAHAKDHNAPYIAIDSQMTNYVTAPHNQKWVDLSNDTYVNPGALLPGAPASALQIQFDGIKLSAQTGIDLSVNIAGSDYMGSAKYSVLKDSGQLLGSVDGTYGNGNLQGAAPGAFTHNYVRMEMFDDTVAPIGVTATGFGNQFRDPNTPGGFGTFVWRRGIDFSTAFGGYEFAISWFRDDFHAEITGPEHWVIIGGPIFVRPVMHRQDGTAIAVDDSLFRTQFCSSDQIFADLMGTRLPLWDPVTTIITPSFQFALFNQFAYPDPVDVDKLLTDLVEAEGDSFYWAAWESYQRTIAGVSAYRARAEWTPWPAEVKHVIGMEDGCDLPTSTDEVFDSVSVRWKDVATGLTRTTIVTSSDPVALLEAAGIHRRGTVDAADNTVGDLGGAITYGLAWLADRAFPRGTGTLTVARPVMDRQTGRLMAPWELRPGCLVQIAGADPSGYSQGATARNGRNVFRVVTVEFDSSRGAATLELDSPPNSVWDQIASASRDFDNRRRR